MIGAIRLGGPARWLVVTILAVSSFGFAGDGLSAFLIERWDSLGADRQAALRDRWAQFKSLSDREQRDLLEYHEVLRDAVPKVLASLPETERLRIDGLDGVARREALRPHLKEWLRNEQQRVTEPLKGDPTFVEGGRVQVAALQEAARVRAGARLHELEQSGVLEPGVAEQLFDLPPWQLMKALRKIRKQSMMDRPPKWLRSLPPQDAAELRGLSPSAFEERVRALRGRAGNADAARISVLEELLGKEPAARRAMGRFVEQLSANPGTARAILHEQLSVEQREALEGLHGKERMHVGMQQLRENAEQALSDRGVTDDEIGAIFRELEGLPNKMRLPYMIRLIHGKPVDGRPEGSPGWRGRDGAGRMGQGRGR